MEDNTKPIESLIEKATAYGKTSIKLARLNALDTTCEVVSSISIYSLAIVIVWSFFLFLSFGVALWLGEMLEKIYLGFFIVATFYGITGIIIYYFFHKSIKRNVGNTLIKKLLKQTT
jgi:hypothetical protein